MDDCLTTYERLQRFYARALVESEAHRERHRATMLIGPDWPDVPGQSLLPACDEIVRLVRESAAAVGILDIDRSLAVGEWAPRG